jgi:hypothetical protein
MSLELLQKAFPSYLKNDAKSVFSSFNIKSEIKNYQTFSVNLRGEHLQIPYRIYFEKPNDFILNSTRSLMLNCLFTRHYDGFLREKCLRRIIRSDEYWIAPFVFQSLGEYVIQILNVIEENLFPSLVENLSTFVSENPEFFNLTKSRVVSYWNEYYRHNFPKIENYVGYRILSKIENHLSQTVS